MTKQSSLRAIAVEMDSSTAATTTDVHTISWLPLIVLSVALGLWTFWILLGWHYSPETYQTTPILLGTVELAWFAIAACCAIALAVTLWRRPAQWPVIGQALLPVLLVSLVVALKRLIHWPIACLDAMLFAAACGWAVAIWLRHSGSKASDREASVGRWLLVAACALGAGLGAFYVWQQAACLRNLALGYQDCGEAARMMFNSWQNPRELFMRINPDKPLFLDHFQPGVLPFVLLWPLLPRLELLTVFQVIGLWVAGCAVYFLGLGVWRDKVAALLLAAAWLVFPSTALLVYKASYGFYWGDLCLPLYFVALALWVRGRDGWALAIALWAVLIKEEAAILVGMFGLYLALFERRRAAGTLLAVGGFAYFLLITAVVVPWFGGGRYIMQGYFTALGTTKWEILMSPIMKPKLFWGKLIDAPSLNLAVALLAPLLFLPVRKPSVLFIGLLPFVFLTQWYNPMGRGVAFWYQIGLLPVVFLALVRALSNHPHRRGLLTGVVVAGVVQSIFLGNTVWSKPGIVVPVSPGRLEIVKRVGAAIDPAGTLVATQRIAAHYVRQKHLYLEPRLPADADYVLMDLRDRWRRPGNLVWLQHLRAFQRRVEVRANLHLSAAEDGILLYARHGREVDAQTRVAHESIPPDAEPLNVTLGPNVIVRSSTMEAVEPHRPGKEARLLVRIYSTVRQTPATDWAARCIVTFVDGPAAGQAYATEFQPLGQGIWSTERWMPGRYYMDEFIINVPVEAAGHGCKLSLVAADLTGATTVAPDEETSLPR